MTTEDNLEHPAGPFRIIEDALELPACFDTASEANSYLSVLCVSVHLISRRGLHFHQIYTGAAQLRLGGIQLRLPCCGSYTVVVLFCSDMGVFSSF